MFSFVLFLVVQSQKDIKTKNRQKEYIWPVPWIATVQLSSSKKLRRKQAEPSDTKEPGDANLSTCLFAQFTTYQNGSSNSQHERSFNSNLCVPKLLEQLFSQIKNPHWVHQGYYSHKCTFQMKCWTAPLNVSCRRYWMLTLLYPRVKKKSF